jgi:hypothetical protein
MSKFKLNSSDYIKIKSGKESITIVKKQSYDKFNEDILGLGKILKKSQQINALSAIFDLEGFTNFCKQIDPQLAVPEYLSEFLKWLFEQIRAGFIENSYKEGYTTWADLPFLSKYLGDGILFLWDTSEMDDTEILNVVVTLFEICNNYVTEFFPKISKSIISAPTKLRCGIALGTVYSVGDGNDFVGPCINMSARLQKLNNLNFCFSRRGINPEDMSDTYRVIFIIKKVDIRGIGSDELVCVVKEEYDKLEDQFKERFINA